MQFENSLAFARELDERDELRHFREKFYIPQHDGKDKIYFTGNSLGLQPKSVSGYIEKELEEWKNRGGEAHFEGHKPWYPYHELFPKQLSGIIGCLPGEVVVMNSLTVNLHLLLVSFYRPTKKRFKIVCEAKAFPSDQYAFESQVRYHGFNPEEAIIEVKPREGEHAIRHEDILQTIEENADSIATVLFSGINYYTGQVFDMKSITDTGHAAGAYVGFDLAHAAGNIALQLHEWNVDFACWCTYKYLNSGPGSVGGLYIHERLAADKTLPRLAGWWGYDKQTRFNMEKGFDPMPTAEGWQLSNAPVFSMAVHKASLDIFEEAGMKALVNKGQLLSDYLIYLLTGHSQSGRKKVEVITPANAKGCQVSMIIPENGKALYKHLMENGVSAGWREPSVLRVAPVSLYNSFSEVWQFVKMLDDF